MKHVGIIAEYNPFHNGHQYQLQTIKKLFPDKKILIIMSGNFVQRGEPAIFNKYLRTKWALSSGADIILELPSLFATASAEHFAASAVLALAATGVIDTLCFGAEYDDLNTFWKIADYLLKEPKDYQKLLKQHLKNGLSFPKARCLALSSCLQDNTLGETILKQPNNILGIEYLKAIRRYHLDITPCIIKRQGSGYHDLSLEHKLSSASALRNKIKQYQNPSPDITADIPSDGCPISDIQSFLPPAVNHTLLKSEFAKPLFLSDFYAFLQYALWQQKNNLEQYFEVSKEISNQLCTLSQYPADIEKLLNDLSHKNYTKTRIRRALLNILLNQTAADMEQAKQQNYITYLRLLGFHSSSAPVLKEMKHNCQVPIINKVADSKKILSIKEYPHFQKDIHISMLYKQAFYNKYKILMPAEYEQTVIIQKEIT